MSKPRTVSDADYFGGPEGPFGMVGGVKTACPGMVRVVCTFCGAAFDVVTTHARDDCTVCGESVEVT